MAVVDILIFVYRPDPRPDFQDGLFLLEILTAMNMYSGCQSVINNGLMIQYGKGKTGVTQTIIAYKKFFSVVAAEKILYPDSSSFGYDTTNLSSFIFQIGAFGNRNFETNVVVSYITIGI